MKRVDFKRSVRIDVTDHKRTPAEESFYESYLLKKQSDVGNLYASNVYEGQSYQKAIKHINRARDVQAAEIEREMKRVHRRMQTLKLQSKNNKLLGKKQLSFGCVRDLTESVLDRCEGSDLSFPVLTRKEQNSRQSSRMYKRGQADFTQVTLITRNDSSDSDSSPQRLSKQNPADSGNGNMEVSGLKPPSGSQSLSCEDVDNGGNVSKAKSGPVVFVTEISTASGENSPKPREKHQDENRNQFDSLEIQSQSKAPTRKLCLSPMYTRRLKQCNAPPNSAEVSCGDGYPRMVKSHPDLTDLDETIFIPKRQRSFTESIVSIPERTRENLQMRYVPRDDRVKSANAALLPKI